MEGSLVRRVSLLVFLGILLGWAGLDLGVFTATSAVFAVAASEDPAGEHPPHPGPEGISRRMAGTIAGDVLARTGLMKLVLIPLLLGTAAGVSATLPQRHWVHTLRWAMVLALVGLALYQILMLNPLLHKLRAEMAFNAEEIAPRFRRLHGYAMMAMASELLWTVGAAALTVLVGPASREPAPAWSRPIPDDSDAAGGK
jgi:hypothetical protein